MFVWLFNGCLPVVNWFRNRAGVSEGRGRRCICLWGSYHVWHFYPWPTLSGTLDIDISRSGAFLQPHLGKTFSLLDLARRHFFFKQTSPLGGCPSQIEPRKRLRIILDDSFPFGIHHTNVSLSLGVSLFNGLSFVPESLSFLCASVSHAKQSSWEPVLPGAVQVPQCGLAVRSGQEGNDLHRPLAGCPRE